MRRRALATLVAVMVLAGCPKARTNPDDEAMLAALAAADAAWAQRGTSGLDAVTRALDGVPASRVDHPEVLWRRVRVGVAEGMVADFPRDARRAYAQARGTAIHCLQAEPMVARSLAQAQVADAARVVSKARGPCAVWAGVAWVRWAWTFEPGAVTMDLPGLGALLDRGDMVADPVHHTATVWARALFVALSAATGEGDAARARAGLLEVARGQDTPWVRFEDAARGLASRPGATPRAAPATPEDRAASARLAAAPALPVDDAAEHD
ncbi:MAG: hypothetical protein H6733_07940 [Alphaproteobacteria bacterium]|nr:hypothetical protein [Alphaproteobacteria bacterium]